MKTRIFLDLDETLTHSVDIEYWDEYSVNYNSSTDPVFLHLSDDEEYVVYKRPVAHDLIEFCRNLAGDDNLYILTDASYEYAKNINNLHNLTISPSRILSMRDNPFVEDINKSINILVDNLNWKDVGRKLAVLYPYRCHVKVVPYVGSDKDETAYLKQLKEDILYGIEHVRSGVEK